MSELRVFIYIAFLMAAFAVGLKLREEYAAWACAALCEERGQYGEANLELLRSRCICYGKLKHAH